MIFFFCKVFSLTQKQNKKKKNRNEKIKNINLLNPLGYLNSGLLTFILSYLAILLVQKEFVFTRSETTELGSSFRQWTTTKATTYNIEKDKIIELGLQWNENDKDTNKKDVIVLLSDNNWLNATLSAIINIREPSMGNWKDTIVVLGYDISHKRDKYFFRYLKCLNVKFLDITNDELKNEFWHLYFWKSYILLHPYFRKPLELNGIGFEINKIIYLDSDVLSIRSWKSLLSRIDWPSHVYVAWREDYRHQSMYKAVIDLNKYDVQTKADLLKEYPDHPNSKQANVMIFDMQKLPNQQILNQEIKRILQKYEKGFWRHDQSLFNLLFYHNSTDLGFSAFNYPPDQNLLHPQTEYMTLIHTGHDQAIRRKKDGKEIEINRPIF
ncbi:hypothetical protein RFI_31657 [Reticulomyxa filosa]|uniref:Uncharacterized protein n=1 Tax=Reticulomyxa filosa TaxID=46433 RepID=X6LUX7_RETFI|nr:hypothetical protein RFI_31657 [Reticulomyxa filosa]|eukprot:ETO05738.1 hypothetical protein RFI_31657 [Reticulomyxa filosa]